ncbi:MAG: PD-(D/E)XK nuclease family protein [Cyanobacteria bacterium J06648_16]
MPTPSLTQTHLDLLETCPRKFQHIFINGLSVPPDPELQDRATWGNQFHLLMQQQALALPIAVMEPVDPKMMACITQLKQAAPEFFNADLDPCRQSETQRTLSFNGYLLTVIYDLLILGPQQAQIIDWKTYQRTPQRDRVEKNWQTRLYLYVLTETSGLEPEQVSMTYWFVRGRDPEAGQTVPESYRFSYSRSQHDRTRTELTELTHRLTRLRALNDFPKVDISTGRCDSCTFARRCGRAELGNERPTAALSLDLATVEEIPL